MSNITVEIFTEDVSATTESIVVEVGYAEGAQGPAGPPGAEGAQGPAGPAGADGSSAAFQYIQGAASDTWTITHNLGYKPGISIVDSAGSATYGDINHVDNNTVVLTFNAAFSGTASLI